ncbi:MAG: hypothetical protein HWE20_02655 [Gammaproteobacteria bacterium]|nr:hypothetical protein [Gammaproteobacteria bacterium]
MARDISMAKSCTIKRQIFSGVANVNWVGAVSTGLFGLTLIATGYPIGGSALVVAATLFAAAALYIQRIEQFQIAISTLLSMSAGAIATYIAVPAIIETFSSATNYLLIMPIYMVLLLQIRLALLTALGNGVLGMAITHHWLQIPLHDFPSPPPVWLATMIEFSVFPIIALVSATFYRFVYQAMAHEIDFSAQQAHFLARFQAQAEALKINRQQISAGQAQIEQVAESLQLSAMNANNLANEQAQGATDLDARIARLNQVMHQMVTSLADSHAALCVNHSHLETLGKTSTQCNQHIANAVNSFDTIVESSRQVLTTIAEIEDLTSQTNMLALNASIEAARAGEFGRGFSVVAMEIRKLATDSNGLATKITEKVHTTLADIDDGAIQIRTSAESLNRMIQSVQDVSRAVSHISSQLEENQTQVEEMLQLASEVAQHSVQSVSRSQQLNDQSDRTAQNMHQLSDVVARMQTQIEMLDQASEPPSDSTKRFAS